MTQTLARKQPVATLTVEQALVTGDLSGLDPDARLNYYMRVCESLGLNPLTKPFDYLSLYDSRTRTSKLVLYARKDATDQLRNIHKVSITGNSSESRSATCWSSQRARRFQMVGATRRSGRSTSRDCKAMRWRMR